MFTLPGFWFLIVHGKMPAVELGYFFEYYLFRIPLLYG